MVQTQYELLFEDDCKYMEFRRIGSIGRQGVIHYRKS